MNKTELISRTSEVLAENDIRKPVTIKSEKFKITSQSGDEATFTVNRADRRIRYNTTDVANILDTMIAIVEDAIRHGETVSIRGFGSLCVRKRKEHMVREPDQEIWHVIPSQYVAKFVTGCNLASAARSYGLQEDDVGAEQFLPSPDDEEDEED